MRPELPIDPHVSRIAETLGHARALVLTAAPGAGKTTRVPPALVADGPVILLQPRRVAARAIARRIAAEQGWTLGAEVGWQVRFERRFGAETRLLVATEGVLTSRLIADPLATGFRTIVLDEFHERSLHADVALALAREAWAARSDLRILVMSATIDPAPVAAYLHGCPVIDVPGAVFPTTTSYQPGRDVSDAAADAARRTRGAVLCFLPGAADIRRAAVQLAASLGPAVPVLPLHGGLEAAEQDAALAPAAGPRIILATNIAETTLTVPDVTVVVDTGLQKVARYDPARAIDSLDLERVSQDSANQRAGRAGRTGPGEVVRLWDARDRLRPHREPDIARVDLASTVLDLAAWGADPLTFPWFESPPRHAIDGAVRLLARLGAIDPNGRITTAGHALRRLPLHPRLARLFLDAGGTLEAARACALLSERTADIAAATPAATTSCDLLTALDRRLPAHVEQVARDLARVMSDRPAAHDEARFRQAVLAAYPDRVARRREPREANTDRLQLATGTGARLARESGVRDAEWLVAVDVRASSARPGDEPLVRIATAIERAWLEPTASDTRHDLDLNGVVRAWQVRRYDALVLHEHPAPVDPETAAGLLAEAWLAREPDARDAQLVNRLRFAGHAPDMPDLVRRAAASASRLADLHVADHLPDDVRRTLPRLAPETIALPSGRTAKLVYMSDGRVTASVRIQDAFGLWVSPVLGPARTPVTFELLAPSGRPVQVTADLAGFWVRGYPEVRRTLAARYPRHRWPEEVPGRKDRPGN